MGHIKVRVKIGNIERTKFKETEGIVDTGATRTIIPVSMAKELELKEIGEAKVKSGAGYLNLKKAEAFIGLQGKETRQVILISDFIDRVLIGVLTLEDLELEVDPLSGTLKEGELLFYLGVGK
ncbi:MAG: aspartyl protease family protein [Candidatus Aenigmarchaeota archaeon]|nr:aspartyl protease family protein [Candidatus Aenigmarchaeota archaeon]